MQRSPTNTGPSSMWPAQTTSQTVISSSNSQISEGSSTMDIPKFESTFCERNANICRCSACLEYNAYRRRAARAKIKGIPVPAARGEQPTRKYVPARWTEYALCKGLDSNWFFGDDRGNSPHVTRAKKICHDCPAKDECLTLALETGERHGIWGGMTVGQRRRLGTNRTPMEDRLKRAEQLRDRFAITQIYGGKYDKSSLSE